MELIFNQTPQFIVAEKPYGITTHQVDDFKDGFKEFLEQKTGRPLAIVSRLDTSTSGLILFPFKESAAEINTLWQSDRCVKTYLFVTDRFLQSGREPIEIKSYIEQKPGDKKVWISDRKKNPNAVSEFVFNSTITAPSQTLYVWQARIKTGKTHQIRLHAKDLGIPILGDTKYSGSPYFRICLHCSEIGIAGQSFKSASPFETLSMQNYPFIAEFERRSRLYRVSDQECFRWLHHEVSNCLLDQYGLNLFFYVYFGNKSSNIYADEIKNLEQAQQLSEWVSAYFNKSIFLKPMYDRGKAPQLNELLYFDAQTKTWKSEVANINWQAIENGIKFHLKSQQGQSPGLFLDQRENRKWILQNSENKSVLNLFSYTGGFSVCAAIGKANQVTTVDLSRNFIEWSKENFTLNELPSSEKYQFWSADTLHFLKGAQNKKRLWDLIICDPPTFGRSDRGVFKIETDIDELLETCFHCLAPRGRILFATNFEKWNLEDVFKRVNKALSNKKLKFALEKTPHQSLDFDFPNQNTKMKSLFIQKLD